jgi:HlyD family secretion protein
MIEHGTAELDKPVPATPGTVTPHQPHGTSPAPGPIPHRALTVVGAAVVALLGWGAWGHYQRAAEASQTQRATLDFVPNVRTAVAKRLDGPVIFTIPGTVAAFDQASIFARATGYVAERRVDIGSRVHKGDRLVLISAPDLDQQLAQANAQLAQMQATLVQTNAQVASLGSTANLAQVTNGRTSQLADMGWETRQNADNTRLSLASSRSNLLASEAAVKVAEANIAAQYATVQRLQELVGFEDVRAPFDGIITTRNVDLGDLVSADSGGKVMFTLEHDDVVRVSVDVPQSGVIGVANGLAAKVHVAELPDRVFEGKVARSSNSLALGSRTMQAEVDVPNTDGTLRPGLYVTVDIGIPRTTPGIVIPAEAIMFNGQGLRVAVVQPDGTVRMQPVTIYRDFGTSVELHAGLKGGENVILSPPVELVDGSHVKAQSAS